MLIQKANLYTHTFGSRIKVQSGKYVFVNVAIVCVWVVLVVFTRMWHEPYRDETEVIYFLAGQPSLVDMINDNLINGGFSWNLIVWLLSGGGNWWFYWTTMTLIILICGCTFFFLARMNYLLKIFLLFNPFYFFDWLVVTRLYTLIWGLSLVGLTLFGIKEKKQRHRRILIFIIAALMSSYIWGMLCAAALILGHVKVDTFKVWIFNTKLLLAKLISLLWTIPHFWSLLLVYGSDYKGGIVSNYQGNRFDVADIGSKVLEFNNRLALFTFGQVRGDYNLWNKKVFPWYLSEAASGWYLLLLLAIVLLCIYFRFGFNSLLKFALVFILWSSFNVFVYMGLERHFYYLAFAPFLVLGQGTRKKVQLKQSATAINSQKKLKNNDNSQAFDSSREFDDLYKGLLWISRIAIAILLISPISYSSTILMNDKDYLFSAAATYGKKLGKQRSYVIFNSSLYPSLLLDNQLSILSLFGPELDRKQTIRQGLALNAFDRNLVYGGKARPERLGKFCSFPNPTLVTTLTTYKVINGVLDTKLPLIDKSPFAMVSDEGDLRIVDLNELCKQDSNLKSLWPHIV